MLLVRSMERSGNATGELLEYIVVWDHSVVSSARAQSKCQLMDCAVQKLDNCTKRRNEFTHPRYAC